MNLDGKTVLLTGASGGIGAHLAKEFSDAGARLILTGRDPAQLQRVRESLSEQQDHQLIVADLSTDAGVQHLAAECYRNEWEVDLLVNNAGLGDFCFLESTDRVMIRALLMVNLLVPIMLTRELLPLLKARQEAACVYIGSAYGSIGYPGFSVYGATKFGLRGFSEALRRELADTHVRILLAAPRATRTALNSTGVVAMNAAMGNVMDAPECVAQAIVGSILKDRWGMLAFGWPERFFIWLNSLAPHLLDRALRRQLPEIHQYARLPLTGRRLQDQLTGEKP